MDRVLNGDVRKASTAKNVFELTRLTERGRPDEEGAAYFVACMAQQRTPDRTEDRLIVNGSPNAGAEPTASDEDSANLRQRPLAILKELQALLASDCVEGSRCKRKAIGASHYILDRPCRAPPSDRHRGIPRQSGITGASRVVEVR